MTFLEAGVKLSSYAFRGLRKLLSCHNSLPGLTGKVSENIHVRFASTTPHPHPTLSFLSVIASTACWGMVRCQRVQSGRPCRSLPTTSLTTWWPSWTSTVWAKVILHPSSIMSRNIKNAVKLSGKSAHKWKKSNCRGPDCFTVCVKIL